MIGLVILCWCLVLLFQTNRAIPEQIRVAFHRSHFRIIKSSWSSVIAVTSRSSFTILALACVSSVGVVTIFNNNNNNNNNNKSFICTGDIYQHYTTLFLTRCPTNKIYNYISKTLKTDKKRLQKTVYLRTTKN